MRILSGIQPTGEIHIGNYLGAVKHWIELQEKHDCVFPVVDLHALTTFQNPKTFKQEVLNKAAELLALGVNPERCILFVQSHIKEHTELAWILNTITPVAELERMTQFKDKAKKQKSNINMGLMDYPVLMAADILLYKTDAVPVGKDQIQHLELVRAIARKFNARFGKTFKEPKALLSKEGAKIMSLKSPKKKMAKSDGPDTYLSMFEEPKIIKKKIGAAVTDTENQITYNPQRKPGISNLLTIYSLFSGKSISSLEKKFKGKGYASFKKSLTGLLIKELTPFVKKKQELLSRQLYVQEILSQGAQKARIMATHTMEEVRKGIGIA